jgi:hypothetical protein
LGGLKLLQVCIFGIKEGTLAQGEFGKKEMVRWFLVWQTPWVAFLNKDMPST